LQTGEELSDKITPRLGGGISTAKTGAAASAPFRLAAVVAAWLVPGAGHLILGRYWRGLLFLVLITGSFLFGLSLHGRVYWPAADSTSMFRVDLISVLWSFAQFGAGSCYLLAQALGLGLIPQPEAPTYEYGNTFMFLAGLLNYLLIMDAFDIAAGRKR